MGNFLFLIPKGCPFIASEDAKYPNPEGVILFQLIEEILFHPFGVVFHYYCSLVL